AGDWIEAAPTTAIAVHNPADGTRIGYVPKLGRAEVAKAINAAEEAQKGWAARTAKDRSTILRKWFVLMIENRDALAHILTLEQGKPLTEAAGDL
ncbi:aldehyde dehydrogenase family protein, partial [Pseudodonghicola flavimaris]